MDAETKLSASDGGDTLIAINAEETVAETVADMTVLLAQFSPGSNVTQVLLWVMNKI